MKNIVISGINSVAVCPIDESFPADRNLIEAGIIDSMQFLDLVALLEERVGVEIDFLEIDASSLTSIQGLASALGAE